MERREAGGGAGVHAPQAEFTFRTIVSDSETDRLSDTGPIYERTVIRLWSAVAPSAFPVFSFRSAS